MNRNWFCCFFLILSTIGWPQIGGSATFTDSQIWLNLTTMGNFHRDDKTPSHFKYWLEGQERMGDNISRFSQTLFRAGMGYSLTENTSIWLGYAFIHTGIPYTINENVENRIWQQFLWVKMNQHLTFTSRTRLEERFFEDNRNTGYRARQFVKVAIPLTNYSKFSVVSSDELFFHLNNKPGSNGPYFDQNRFFVGFGYKLNSKLNIEMGYLNQNIKRAGFQNFLANVLLINFILTLA